MAVLTEAPGTCQLFNGKIMTFLTEELANLSTIQWQYSDSSDRRTRKSAYYSMAKIMAVLRVVLGNLPTVQCQDHDSSDRRTRKPA